MTTPGLRVNWFDVDAASARHIADYHRFRLATVGTWTDEPPADEQTALGAVREHEDEGGPMRPCAVYLDERLVGFSQVWLPRGDSAHVGVVWPCVHPEVRGRGVGTALLRFLVAELCADGRTAVEGSCVQDSAGHRWALGLGARPVHATVLQRLAITTADRSRWDVPAPAGYRAVAWSDDAPDDLVAGYAAARNAMQDAPTGESAYRSPHWTPERIREHEAECVRAGHRQRVVVAVHEATGEVAGLTVLSLHAHRDDLAFQGDTAVIGAHRGHGLGRFVKAEMARWLVANEPTVTRVITSTGAANRHMIRVNHEIGYTTTRTMLLLHHDLPVLASRLGL